MALDRRTLAAAAAASLLPLASALAGDAQTTRIETRPFYGATVTLEHGVRVFRALPPHGNVIINPGGVTPLHLGIEQHRSYNYNYGAPAAADGSGGYHGGGGHGGYGAPVHGGYGSHGGYGHGGAVARPAHRAHYGARHGHHGRHGHGGYRGHGSHGGGHGGGGKR